MAKKTTGYYQHYTQIDEYFSWIPERYYSRIGILLGIVYLLVTFILIVYAVLCTDFLCGLLVITPIFPLILLTSWMLPAFQYNASFLFTSYWGYAMLSLLQFLLVYLFILLVRNSLRVYLKIKL